MGTKSTAAKSPTKRVAKKSGSVEAKLQSALPESGVRLMSVIANALVTSKNGKSSADVATATRLGEAIFPTDQEQAAAFVTLVKRAQKDFATSRATSTTPFF